MDWETAFEACPLYSRDTGRHTHLDTVLLSAVKQSMESLRESIPGDRKDVLEEYLTCQQEYLHRCCRYYFYRGMLYGTREALSTWTEEYTP